jgi:hypothetical protein
MSVATLPSLMQKEKCAQVAHLTLRIHIDFFHFLQSFFLQPQKERAMDTNIAKEVEELIIEEGFQGEIQSLADFQLALVGGGIADVIGV